MSEKPTDITASFYDRHWTDIRNLPDLEGKKKQLVMVFGDTIKDKSVLDCGCGSGITSIAFSESGARKVVGIDQSEECILFAVKQATNFNISNYKFLQVNLLDPDSLDTMLGSERFDIVYSFGVLHHTSDIKRAFQNISKYVTGDGELCVGLYLKTKLTHFFNFLGRIYRSLPKFIQEFWCFFILVVLKMYDSLFGKKTLDNARLREEVHDWFGVPKRSHHSPDEVKEWFSEAGFNSRLVVPRTGRFRFSSNFIMVGKKEKEI